ncbi:MAG: DUF4388 domain-containing protein [Chloroflexaceae bacterium]|nr:DUF4388 domain-containing protein [Chloroflexaceae bacterium]
MSLKGTLQDMPLVDLLYVFRAEEKSGVLFLVDETQRGGLHVCRGRPIDARVIKRGEQCLLSAHDEAIIQMLLWNNATFVFRHEAGMEKRPVHVQRSVEQLIIESVRRHPHPCEALLNQTITPNTEVRIAQQPMSPTVLPGLETEHWDIIRRFSSAETRHTARTLSTMANCAELLTLRFVVELLALNILEVAPVRRMQRTTQARPVPPEYAAPTTDTLVHPTAGLDTSSSEARSLLNAILQRVKTL